MDEENKKYPKELYSRGISTSTSPGNVNQLQEYLSKISSGYPGVEIQTFSFLEKKDGQEYQGKYLKKLQEMPK